MERGKTNVENRRDGRGEGINGCGNGENECEVRKMSMEMGDRGEYVQERES